MPTKGLEEVRRNLKATFEEISGPMTEKCITEVLIVGGGYADLLTPVAFSTLINSRFRKVDIDRCVVIFHRFLSPFCVFKECTF